MAYELPNVVVHESPRAVPPDDAEVLFAHISGGHAQLALYTDDDVHDLIHVGAYDSNIDQAFSWPNLTNGGIVDQDYTKVFLEDAKLFYFDDLVSSDQLVAPVSGYKSRVRRAGSYGFVANGDYERDPLLLDRDVKVGDGVYIRGVVSSVPYTLTTYVLSITGDTVAASIDTAEVDDDNWADQHSYTTISQTAGDTSLLALTASMIDYNGYIDGYIDDTYTVTVTSGSVSNDLTSAVLRISSASGLDDDVDVSPAATGVYFYVGARGLKLKFTGAHNLVAGQKWSVAVGSDFDSAGADSGGTYTGTKDVRYIIEVTKGGLFADADNLPQVTVRSDIGYDGSAGPVEVLTAATHTAVGTKGVWISFDSGASGGTLEGLRKGDLFYIDAVAAAIGRMGTLVLGHNLPDELLEVSDLDLRLFIKKNFELTENRVGFDPDVNWETSDTEITLLSGAIAYDDSWTDGGVQQALTIESAEIYVQYRAWLPDHVGQLVTIGPDEELDDVVSGLLHKDNPLKYGLNFARLNAAGTPVKFTAVEDPSDSEKWGDTLSVITGVPDTYNLAPCTDDETILSLVQAHVAAQSGDATGCERRLWRALYVERTKVIISAATSSDGDPVLAKVLDDPDTSGTQYTLVTATSGNSQFVTDGVRPNDVVRYAFHESFGVETYSEAVVDVVVNEETIRLKTGLTAAINSSERIEVWRTLTATDYATSIAQAGAALGSKRVSAIWPDTFEVGSDSVPGYYAACIYAGKRSGAAPHQPFTNVPISGVTSVKRTTELFNATQLNIMAASGVHIITQDRNGNVFARHALTTDQSDLNTGEEMSVTNIDSIKKQLRTLLRPFVGRTLANTITLNRVDVELRAKLAELGAQDFNGLGPQFENGTVSNLRRDTLHKDKFRCTITGDAPASLNRIEIDLVF